MASTLSTGDTAWVLVYNSNSICHSTLDTWSIHRQALLWSCWWFLDWGIFTVDWPHTRMHCLWYSCPCCHWLWCHFSGGSGDSLWPFLRKGVHLLAIYNMPFSLVSLILLLVLYIKWLLRFLVPSFWYDWVNIWHFWYRFWMTPNPVYLYLTFYFHYTSHVYMDRYSRECLQPLHLRWHLGHRQNERGLFRPSFWFLFGRRWFMILLLIGVGYVCMGGGYCCLLFIQLCARIE